MVWITNLDERHSYRIVPAELIDNPRHKKKQIRLATYCNLLELAGKHVLLTIISPDLQLQLRWADPGNL